MGLFGRGTKRGDEPGHAAMALADGESAVGRHAAASGASHPATAQHMLATGSPAVKATVESVAFTGSVVGDDPVVDLVVRLASGPRKPVRLRTVVPRITVPRPGEAVLLVAAPEPGAYLYAGLSL
ncbi:hypothetical protein [Actinokineospora inagensis]|uniref:hypothetical protein n=1 Tax=Actinokineospora inagensis TaxID=103730 RepID=UPI000420A73C|nr:hypothetical protein [Actinokineospora inagensis]